ncbi:Homologous-pairing protein 2 like protein, partial [Nosema granulosis]
TKNDTKNTASSYLDNLISKYSLKNDTLKMFLIFYNSNRPFSSTEIALSFPKKVTETSLSELIRKDLIIQKTYNKSKLYMLNVDYEDIPQSRIEESENKLSALKDSYKLSQSTLASLQTSLTEEEILSTIQDLETELSLLDSKLQSGSLYSEETVSKLHAEYKSCKKILKDRSEIYKNILEILSEKLNLKKTDLLEEVGIEE